MSRLRRTFHGVASSYVLLAATAIYSLASVPMALHYLDTPRFGLWMVMGTLVGYLSLIDAGMTGAAARLLIDHKDDRAGGGYGGLIQTGCLVSTVQGGIIFVIGLTFAATFARLLSIDAALQPEFIQLIHWQCGVVALSFATRMFNLLLSAHQRMDVANYIGIAGLLVNFATQWIFFHNEFGVLSLALGSLVSTLLMLAGQALGCSRLRLYPASGGWGRVSARHFGEIFNYGKDMFLVSVGTQLITASQIIVITRMLGLEAAAVWAIGLRVFNLVNQVIWRLSDMSGAALAEMLARGELARLRDRYRSLAIVSFSFAGWAAVSFALCNSLFITLWTHGKIHWPPANDWLLAAWMIVLTMLHCHNSFVLLTKKINFMRYIYFVEGVVFVGLTILVARTGGLPAIIGCSIVCSLLFSGAYGVWRISRFFEFSRWEVAVGWLWPMTRILLFYLTMAVLVWWLSGPLPGLFRLGIGSGLAGSAGLYFFLRHGLPVGFQEELLRRVPSGAGLLLKRVFIQPAK